MTDNTVGPHPARIQFVSPLSYPPLFSTAVLHAPSRKFSSVYLPSSLVRAFFLLLVDTPRGCPSITHGRSLVLPTLQILLQLSLSFGTFQDSGILKQVTRTCISPVCSVLGSYHSIIQLVVHFSTLIFCCLLCCSTRCSVHCRLLPNYPFTTTTLPTHPL